MALCSALIARRCAEATLGTASIRRLPTTTAATFIVPPRSVACAATQYGHHEGHAASKALGPLLANHHLAAPGLLCHPLRLNRRRRRPAQGVGGRTHVQRPDRGAY